ncbi:MAG: FkbM family methyltransferase, partial [bacterium]
LGQALLEFQKTNLYTQYPWEIFAIEANPYLIDKLSKASNITVMNKAIWIKDGTIKFYINTTEDSKSSLIPLTKQFFIYNCYDHVETFLKRRYKAIKRRLGFTVTKRSDVHKIKYPVDTGIAGITVESINFGKWLQQNFKKEDYIIVSFDIEGAEYRVLDKMLRDRSVLYIDRLYVEFNNKTMMRKTIELLTEIKKLGIIVGNDSVEDIIEKREWLDYLE